MKTLNLVLAICSSSAAFAQGTINLTHGGSYTASDGSRITCTGSTVKRDTVCLCNYNHSLIISQTLGKGSATLAGFNNKADCLRELRARPECN